MKISGEFTVADIYYSGKTGNTTLTLIPDNGGIARFSIVGTAEGLKPRDEIIVDSELTIRNYREGGYSYSLDPMGIKKLKRAAAQ